MRSVVFATLSLILGSTQPAVAQVAGWLALAYSPVGGLGPLVPDAAPKDAHGLTFLARFGTVRVRPSGSATKNGVTIGTAFSRARIRYTAEVGRMSVSDCPCVGIMGGFDATIPIEVLGDTMHRSEPVDSARELRIALNPAIGFMKPTNGTRQDWAASLAVSLPLSTVISVGTRGRLVPFIAPGVGAGRFNSATQSGSGELVLLGGGLALTDYFPGVGITAGFRKIFIDNQPGTTVVGLALTWGKSSAR